MHTEILKYEADGLKFESHLYFDKSKIAKRPAVLVFPEAFGLGEHAKSKAKRLAELGYVTLASDLHGGGKIVRGGRATAIAGRRWIGSTRCSATATAFCTRQSCERCSRRAWNRRGARAQLRRSRLSRRDAGASVRIRGRLARARIRVGVAGEFRRRRLNFATRERGVRPTRRRSGPGSRRYRRGR